MELKYKGNYEISAIVNAPGDVENVDLLNDGSVRRVRAFHATLPGYAPTPLVSLGGLSEKLGVSEILVKDESHRFGLNAFKSLGGTYALGKLLQERFGIPDDALTFKALQSPEISEKIKEMTFISATDGNHGKGLAWFAGMLGAKSYILMPRNSVKARVAAIQQENARVVVTDMNYDDTVREANRLAEENGWIMVQDTSWEGYEKIPAWITQGYSTMAHEVLEQLKASGKRLPTHVFLQAGVGSMAGGVIGFLVNRMGRSMPRAIIVEADAAACIYKSARAGDGRPHAVTGNHETMMAGLACGEPNVRTWKILRDHARAFISCSDEFAAAGMRRLARPEAGDPKIISGESGAVGVGLLEALMVDGNLGEIKEKLGLDQDSVVLFFSTEGDTDLENYNRVMAG